MKNQRIELFVTSSSSGHPAYSHFSLPLAKGDWHSDVPLSIRNVDSVQTWPLAYWPDGSVRVIHGIAPLSEGCYEAELGTPSPQIPGLRIEETESLEIYNASEILTFRPDNLSPGPFDLELQVTWADGSIGEVQLESGILIRRSGNLYAQVERWAKVVSGDKYLRFRLQFECFWKIPGIVLNVLLVHDCPGIIFQDIRSIQTVIRKPNSKPVVFQQNHGFEYLDSRFVDVSEADIRVDATNFLPYVHNSKVLRDDTVYPHYLRPPANRTRNAVFLKNGGEGLQIEMEDFHLLRPKGILLKESEAAFALWPDWAQTLHLQQGRRRQVRLAIHWGAMPENWNTAQQATASLLDVHRCQLAAETYADVAFFDQSRVLRYDPGKNPRFEGWLQAASKLNTVADFFHLGDTKDSHYQTTYMPLGYSKHRTSNEKRLPDIYTDGVTHAQCLDRLDEYEPIWVNNEYDVIFALGTEYLRGGNLALYRQLRRFARHTVEVDFLCYSDYPAHHRAQPTHSENHTSTGAYPSHFWTQGLTQYYFLSGDEDALEVIQALADKTIWYFEHPILGALHSGINREMGWAILTLVSAYEATNDPQYDAYARKLIDSIIQEPLAEDMPGFSFGETSFLLGCRAYLQVHGHSEASRPVWDGYLQMLDLAIHSSRFPPEKKNSKLNLQLSYGHELAQRGALHRNKSRSGIMTGFAAPDCLAYAYERTGEKKYLDAGLRALTAFLDGNPGYFASSISFRNPSPEGKSFAWTYRTWINYLGALDRTNMLKPFDY